MTIELRSDKLFRCNNCLQLTVTKEFIQVSLHKSLDEPFGGEWQCPNCGEINIISSEDSISLWKSLIKVD